MADIFTLEALDAKFGDALLLHYGDSNAPRLIVIDGGPASVYADALRPRLDEIQQNRGGGQLEIRMLMVSHIDLDHINGVLKLTGALLEDQEAGRPLPFDILTLWHNSFDDLVGQTAASALMNSGAAAAASFGELGAIIAGVKEGRQLRKDADALTINMNSGFDALIQFDAAAKPLKISKGLTFTVVGPRKEQLDKLKGKWKKEIDKIVEDEKKKEAAIAAAKADTSIHNLSSIVVLAEFGGAAAKRSILFTGDAGGTFIVESLKDAGLLNAAGTMKVDVLKLPHHGSARNCTSDLMKAVHADHYIASANGRDGNPDNETFDNLFAARPGGGYTIWLTNEVAPAVAHIKAKKPASVKLQIRKKTDSGIKVQLAGAI